MWQQVYCKNTIVMNILTKYSTFYFRFDSRNIFLLLKLHFRDIVKITNGEENAFAVFTFLVKKWKNKCIIEPSETEQDTICETRKIFFRLTKYGMLSQNLVKTSFHDKSWLVAISKILAKQTWKSLTWLYLSLFLLPENFNKVLSSSSCSSSFV